MTSLQEAERMMGETGCDAVMIARAAIRNPWVFNGFSSSHDRILSNRDRGQNENPSEDYWPTIEELTIAEKQYFEYVKLSNSKQKFIDFHRNNFQRLRNSILSGNRSQLVGSPRTIHL